MVWMKYRTWLQKCSRLWRVILNMDEKRRMSRERKEEFKQTVD